MLIKTDQLYLHTFIATDEGNCSVVQQGMNDANGMARRYHWNCKQFKSFIHEPHTSIFGKNSGMILNLTHANADCIMYWKAGRNCS